MGCPGLDEHVLVLWASFEFRSTAQTEQRPRDFVLRLFSWFDTDLSGQNLVWKDKMKLLLRRRYPQKRPSRAGPRAGGTDKECLG